MHLSWHYYTAKRLYIFVPSPHNYSTYSVVPPRDRQTGLTSFSAVCVCVGSENEGLKMDQQQGSVDVIKANRWRLTLWFTVFWNLLSVCFGLDYRNIPIWFGFNMSKSVKGKSWITGLALCVSNSVSGVWIRVLPGPHPVGEENGHFTRLRARCFQHGRMDTG